MIRLFTTRARQEGGGSIMEPSVVSAMTGMGAHMVDHGWLYVRPL